LKCVWGNGLAYATDTSGNVQAVYHADGLGSVRAITDGSGNVTQTYQTDEFGVPSLTQGTDAQPFGYTGEQRDAEPGFVLLRGTTPPRCGDSCRTIRCSDRSPTRWPSIATVPPRTARWPCIGGDSATCSKRLLWPFGDRVKLNLRHG
jgi:hypothetical protein